MNSIYVYPMLRFFSTSLSRFKRDRQGNIATVFGIALVPVMIFTGAAVDYSRATRVQSHMQAAMDAAMLAVATLETGQATVAERVYRGYVQPDAVSQAVSFWTDADGRFWGQATAQIPTAFMKAVGIDNLPVTVATATKSKQALRTACMLLTATSGTALTMQSNAVVDLSGCELHVRSTSATAVDLKSGATVSGSRLCIAGGVSSSSMKQTNYEEGCTPATDPFASKLPVPKDDGGVCTYNAQTISTSITLNEGSICNGMTFDKPVTVTFAPGFYRVRGGSLIFNSSVNVIAHGVTFYFEDALSSFQMNSSSNLDITAPTSGIWSGIAMYEPVGLAPSPAALRSSSDASLEGLVYLPSRDLSLSASSTFTARKTTLVAHTANLASTSSITVTNAADATKRIYTEGPSLVR